MLGQLNHFTYALAAFFPERRVVLLDRPGSGFSQPAPSQRIKAQGEIAAKVMDRLGLKKPLVVGHSLGGAIALALALDHPENVGGLALVAPLTQPVPSPLRSRLTQSRPALWLFAWTLGPITSLSRAGAARDEVFAPDPMPLRFWSDAGGLLATRPSAIIAAVREMAEISTEMAAMTGRYASLAMPVGVLFAQGDKVLDAKAQGADFCAVTPGAELTLVDGGHMLPVTQPKLVEDFIRKMLGRARGDAR
jgi:pimeloyl-ACP methyl ester carboxylesterase